MSAAERLCVNGAGAVGHFQQRDSPGRPTGAAPGRRSLVPVLLLEAVARVEVDIPAGAGRPAASLDHHRHHRHHRYYAENPQPEHGRPLPLPVDKRRDGLLECPPAEDSRLPPGLSGRSALLDRDEPNTSVAAVPSTSFCCEIGWTTDSVAALAHTEAEGPRRGVAAHSLGANRSVDSVERLNRPRGPMSGQAGTRVVFWGRTGSWDSVAGCLSPRFEKPLARAKRQETLR